MPTSDKAAMDKLTAAIRDAGGKTTGAQAHVKSEAKSHDALTDLDSALRAAGGISAPTSAGKSPASEQSGSQALNAALRGQLAEATTKHNSPSATPVTPQLTLDAALREAGGRARKPVLPVGNPRTAPDRSAGLNQALRDVDLPEPAPPAETFVPRLYRRLIVIAAVALLAIGSAALWWSQSRLSGVPAILHDLAGAVEEYRSAHDGHLPDTLSIFKAFPADAIEWPIRYWLARDAAGRTEIFWVRQGSSHYRIILRQSSSVWIYNDKDRQSRLAKQGAQ